MKSNKAVGSGFFSFLSFLKKVHVGEQCCPPPTRIGFIKERRPMLNIDDKSVPLKLFN